MQQAAAEGEVICYGNQARYYAKRAQYAVYCVTAYIIAL